MKLMPVKADLVTSSSVIDVFVIFGKFSHMHIIYKQYVTLHVRSRDPVSC